MSSVPGVVAWTAMPSQECFCCSMGGGVQDGEQASAGGDFHADDAHLLLDGQGQQLFGEAVVMRIGGIDGHQNGVEGMAVDGLDRARRGGSGR